jgi:hypothetical protein
MVAPAAMAVSLESGVMAAMVPKATPRPQTEALVALAAIPASRVSAQRAAREPQQARTEVTEWRRHPAAMEEMAETGLITLQGAEATEEAEAMEDRSAMAALVATEEAGLAMGSNWLSPVVKAGTVGVADQPAEMEGSAAQEAMPPPMVLILLP